MKNKFRMSAILISILIVIAFTIGCTKDAKPISGNKKTTEPSQESSIISSKYNIGDVVNFGKYEQDNNQANGKEKIAWKVLCIENGKALLISEKTLDAKAYNDENTSVTWETCSLRNWLNNDFINSAFSTNEQAKIATTKLTNKEHPEYKTAGGNDTEDKLFFLSIEEAELHFKNAIERRGHNTAYAKAQGAKDEEGGWWLRSPGLNPTSAAIVINAGYVGTASYVNLSYIGVRPALWINN